jgi:hypothetical protein
MEGENNSGNHLVWSGVVTRGTLAIARWFNWLRLCIINYHFFPPISQPLIHHRNQNHYRFPCPDSLRVNQLKITFLPSVSDGWIAWTFFQPLVNLIGVSPLLKMICFDLVLDFPCFRECSWYHNLCLNWSTTIDGNNCVNWHVDKLRTTVITKYFNN